MSLLDSFKKRAPNEKEADENGYTSRNDSFPDAEHYKGLEDTPVRMFRLRIIIMGLLVSMGGLIFGYDTGQISGFIAMNDFLRRFHDIGNSPDTWDFTNSREGTIVGLVYSTTFLQTSLIPADLLIAIDRDPRRRISSRPGSGRPG